MTHELMLASNANTLYTADSLDICVIDGAGENKGRRLSDMEKSVSPLSAMAHISLILIVLLILTHSGYWALLLPSWLALAAFLSGASDSTGYDDGRVAAHEGSL